MDDDYLDLYLDYSEMLQEAQEENAKLRDEIKHRDELEAKLIRCIENDYGIVFAWDPLRKVWLSECTEEYVTERERLDAENAKLRELVREMWACISHIGEYDVFYYDMAEDGCGIGCTVNGEHCCANKMYDRMREQGIEAY